MVPDEAPVLDPQHPDGQACENVVTLDTDDNHDGDDGNHVFINVNDNSKLREIINNHEPDESEKTKFVINPELSESGYNLIKGNLECRQGMYSTSLSTVGYHDDNMHRIDTEQRHWPHIKIYNRTAPGPKVQREIYRQVQELLKFGFIEPSTSQWQSLTLDENWHNIKTQAHRLLTRPPP